MRKICRAVEQVFHERTVFVRARIVEQVACLRGRRNSADQVEVNAPQQLGIVGWPRRPYFGLVPLGGKQAIYLLG